MWPLCGGAHVAAVINVTSYPRKRRIILLVSLSARLLKCAFAVKLRSELVPSGICDGVVVVVIAVMFFLFL